MNLTKKQHYLQQAKEITAHIADLMAIPAVNYGINPEIGYYAGINLKLICHPVNLTQNSSLTLKELKKLIRKYENSHGKVEFPTYFQYNFHQHDRINPVIMGFDPGSRNFGVFVGKITGFPPKNIKIIDSFLLAQPLTLMTQQRIQLFLSQIDNLYIHHQPDHVIIERFQSRGFKGKLSELVNIMIGLIAARQDMFLHRKINTHIITPSSWKNQFNRIDSLPEIYEMCKGIGDHRTDAALMAIIYLYPDINRNTLKDFIVKLSKQT